MICPGVSVRMTALHMLNLPAGEWDERKVPAPDRRGLAF